MPADSNPTAEKRVCPKCNREPPPGGCDYCACPFPPPEAKSSKTVNLPTWEECKKAVDADRANPLETFIYENEPALTEKAQDLVRKCIPSYSRRADEQFRGMLADLIAFVSNAHETSDDVFKRFPVGTIFQKHAKGNIAVLTPDGGNTVIPRELSAIERLHNICDALSEQADESPFTREEWERIDKQTVAVEGAARALLDKMETVRSMPYHAPAWEKEANALRTLVGHVKPLPEKTSENCEHGVPRRFCTAVHEEKAP